MAMSIFGKRRMIKTVIIIERIIRESSFLKLIYRRRGNSQMHILFRYGRAAVAGENFAFLGSN
jgi:hypothetical protein